MSTCKFPIQQFGFVLSTSLLIAEFSAQAAGQSVWQKMKQQVLQQQCQQGNQKVCQTLAQANQKQSQQAPQTPPSGEQPGQQSPGSGRPQQSNDNRVESGLIRPPAGTKIEETVMAPVAPGAKFFVSPHGVHVATFEDSGSRAVIYYDGVAGPKSDEILGGDSNLPTMVQVVFRPDGKRYAYCGHLGDEFVVVVDGKELTRSSESNLGKFNGGSCALGFTSNSKHVYYTSYVVKSSMTGGSYYRFVFDGQSAPLSSPTGGQISPVFSPDGNHYAYVATDPADQHKWGLVIDGKLASYRGGAPQWSADSQHLYTVLVTSVPGHGQVAEAMLDGKTFMRADRIELHVAPVGNMVVAEVNAASNTPQPLRFLVVVGKKIPGTEIVHRRGANFDQVTISPDGKHYAARFTSAGGRQYVFVDGKRGQNYQFVDHIAFTADSSNQAYTAFTNGKPYLVIGDQESDACQPPAGEIGVTLAPLGARAGSICTLTGGAPTLYMDGKTLPLPAGATAADNLHFSPDGQHYAYSAMYRDASRRLVIDGAAQMESNLAATNNNPGNQIVFSPDSRHIAMYSLAPKATGQYTSGMFLDGKYVQGSVAAPYFYRLEFTADSKHLVWAQPVAGRQGLSIVVDGKTVVEADAAMDAGSRQGWWDMSPDGSLSILAQDDNNLKRITITPSLESNLAAMGGGGALVARNR
jgi:hypothetical protein